jgi:hypothetical protein
MVQDFLVWSIATELIKKSPALYRELEVAHLSLQKPTSGPYLEPVNPVQIFTPYLSKIKFNIIFSAIAGFPKWSVAMRIFNQNSICISHFIML